MLYYGNLFGSELLTYYVISGSSKMKENVPKRWMQLKRVIEELRNGGWFYPKDLAEQLEIPYSTVKHDLRIGKHIGIFKQEQRRGPYAWIEYDPEEPMIRKAIEDHFPHGVNARMLSKYTTTYDPFEEALKDAAVLTGNDPRDSGFRERFFKVVKKIRQSSS